MLIPLSEFSEYQEWLTNFLGSVELPIVFYCAPSMAAYVRNLRGNKASQAAPLFPFRAC